MLQFNSASKLLKTKAAVAVICALILPIPVHAASMIAIRRDGTVFHVDEFTGSSSLIGTSELSRANGLASNRSVIVYSVSQSKRRSGQFSIAVSHFTGFC